LTLIGNVNQKTVLQDGPVEAIEAQVKECIRDAASGGGYILASDHSIHPGLPAEHVKFMFDVAKRLGAYRKT
jgi:uroporphyrinogen-III decarboxylase